MPAIDDLRDLLERQLGTIERTSDGVREGSDPEDLHRFRVAVRRTRALIRASRPLVRDQLAPLDRDLRWLGSATGPVRDLDVLIEHLRELEPELEPDRVGARAIIAALELERLRRRDVLITALDAIRYRELLRRFSEVLPTLEAAAPDVSLEHLARKELDRLRDDYAALGADPLDDDVHAIRIRAKHARYAAELAAMASGDRFTELADALADVQDVIGVHQDAHVAEERVREVAADESFVAAGRIAEIERGRRKRARNELPEAMREVERRAAAAFR